MPTHKIHLAIAKILEEGIIMWNTIGQLEDDKYNHVCLYKKNKEYNYDSPDAIIHWARAEWVDRCFVLVINPKIEAKKATKVETNLVDVWRGYNNISPNDIIGIALLSNYI